jgi:hypothetical protein
MNLINGRHIVSGIPYRTDGFLPVLAWAEASAVTGRVRGGLTH